MVAATLVATVNGEVEAQQIRAFLLANDIRCEFRGEALRNVHGFTLNGLGCVEVHVEPGQYEAARTLLARADAGEFRDSD